MFLPVFAMFAGGQQDYIVSVVDMIQSVSCLRADTCEISLPFEHQQVFPGRRRIVEITYTPPFKWVILGEQRDGDIKGGSEVDHVCAGLGQHGLAHPKTQILCVVRPGARVEIEYEMVPAIVPRWQVLDAKSDVLDILDRELVPV